ncbi:MAG: Rrf2 family transcriptional regulator [Bacteroidales bacterium]|nr:Rrf2 family transcriptional regulator [Bacteroidales bacterium]
MLVKRTEYAIRALISVAIRNRKGERPGFKDVAALIGAPKPFTAKILQEMTKRGLIKSIRGRGGGFFFDSPPESLTLYQVIKSMEGLSFFTKCAFGFNECSDEHPCPIHAEYLTFRQGFLDLTKQTTIGALAGKVIKGEAFLSWSTSMEVPGSIKLNFF